MKKFTLIPLLLIFLVGCQEAVDQFSPDQVMEKAIASSAEEVPYYGEIKITIEDADDKFVMDVKEWRKGDKSLEETTSEGETMVTLKEGTTIKMYDVTANVLYETEFDDSSELNLSSKERVENLLELTEDTHTIEKQENETIAGREAIHLIAEKKPNEKSLYGTQEIWIDKENWLVLKTANHSADSYSIIEYTKLELDAQIDDDEFTLDLPDDVTIEDFSDDLGDEEITLEEAVEKMDEPFLYIQEDDAFTIEEVTYFVSSDDDYNMESVDISYNKDGLPYVNVSIIKSDDSDEDFTDDDELSEAITVRDESGSYVDLDEMKMIDWNENGLTYNLWFINPNVTLEEMTELAETLEEVETK